MAELLAGTVALCMMPQGSGFGTINTTISGLTTGASQANGLLLGLDGEGYRGSGITIPKQTAQRLELARNGLSRRPGQLEEVIHEGLSIVLPFGGARNTASTPKVATDFALSSTWPGMRAALLAAGLADAAVSVGYNFTPADLTYASVALWYKGRLYKFRDCTTKVTLTHEGQKAPRAKIDLERLGTLVSVATQTPTITNGNGTTVGNQTTAVAKCRGVANTFGGTLRNFSKSEIVISPDIQVLGLGNDSTSRLVQNGTNIDFEMTMLIDDGAPSYDEDNLSSTSAPSSSITFGVENNAATADGAVCNAHAITLANVEGQSVEVSDETGKYAANKFIARATVGASGAQGSEFILRFQ